MSFYTTEVVRRVFENDPGISVQIGPSGDFPGNVVLTTWHNEACAEYFGKIRLDMPAEFMRQVARAILSAADEAEIQKV